MRMGSSFVEITPAQDVPLLGYDFRQEFLPASNAGVRDPLFIQVLALDAEDGAGPALICSMDLCIVSVSFARTLRQAAAKACDIHVDRVMLSCSHTHSGPWLDEAAINEDLGAVLPHVQGDKGLTARQRYTQSLPAKLAEAAALAAGLCTPADVFYREMPLGLGYNRRVPKGDGRVAQCWNPLNTRNWLPCPRPTPAWGLSPWCSVAAASAMPCGATAPIQSPWENQPSGERGLAGCCPQPAQTTGNRWPVSAWSLR